MKKKHKDSKNIEIAKSCLLKAGEKKGNCAVQEIRKAINHLHFELDRLVK